MIINSVYHELLYDKDVVNIRFPITEREKIREWLSTLNIKEGKDYDITIKQHRERRSLDQNSYFWECIGIIATAKHIKKWDAYLQALKDYGKYTYLVVKPNAVEAVKKQWREAEIVGEVDINGKKGVQLLCYFGSSTYNTKEFSDLLDGVIGEIHEMGLEVPEDEIKWTTTKKLEKNGEQ